MLPILIKLGGDAASAWWLYLLALALVAYAAWSGWRSADAGPQKKPQSKKQEKASAEVTQKQRLQKALLHGVIGAVVARIGLYYALPGTYFLGEKGEGIPVHTYGLMIGAGFLGALMLAAELAKREWGGALGEKRKLQVYDLAFWLFLAGIGGSVLLFRLVNWQDTLRELAAFPQNPVKFIVGLFSGGLVFYGGLIGAAVAAYVYTRRHGMEFIRFLDLGLPAVSFGQALGRLGCFAAGCCWGKPVSSGAPFAVTFPDAAHAPPLLGGPSNTASLAFSSQARNGDFVDLVTGQVTSAAQEGSVQISRWVAEHGHTLPIHPTQIYESIGQVCILAGLLFLRRYRRFHGMIAGLWLVAYACLRTSVELLRGDAERGTLHGLWSEVPLDAWYNISTSQLISLGIFGLGVTLLWRQSRGAKREAPTPPAGAASVA